LLPCGSILALLFLKTSGGMIVSLCFIILLGPDANI
jgi:hypothetical protein